MVNKKARVLVVDDEQVVCDLLHDELNERGFLCTTVLSGGDALTELGMQSFDVVLLDIRLPGMSGMEVLREIWLNHANTATIMMTAVNEVNTAVKAMKLGASDYIIKPFDLDRVTTSIRTALDTKQVGGKPSAELDAIARGVEARLDPFFGYSKVVNQRTTEIARKLGIAEGEIKQWAAAKAMLDLKRDKMVNFQPTKVAKSTRRRRDRLHEIASGTKPE